MPLLSSAQLMNLSDLSFIEALFDPAGLPDVITALQPKLSAFRSRVLFTVTKRSASDWSGIAAALKTVTTRTSAESPDVSADELALLKPSLSQLTSTIAALTGVTTDPDTVKGLDAVKRMAHHFQVAASLSLAVKAKEFRANTLHEADKEPWPVSCRALSGGCQTRPRLVGDTHVGINASALDYARKRDAVSKQVFGSKHMLYM